MQSFRKITFSTLIAVYVLIVVGGVVRSTGAGMGCPDWPKCFGSWIPPSSVEDLPENYKEIYADYRDKKNQRFAKYLRAVGMQETATALLNDPTVRIESDFNVTKTWIEYFNRIVGVIIGFMIIGVCLSSLKLRRVKSRITVLAFASLVLVIFQGWIGSFVVSSNLTPWTITVHMFLALLLVAMLIYLVHISTEIRDSAEGGFWWILACMFLVLVQILFGTQVREALDEISVLVAREKWIENLDTGVFIIHRSFSWIVLLAHVGLIVRLRKTRWGKAFATALIMLILGTILSGTAMAYAGVPPFLQPIHLLLATLTFGVHFHILLKAKPSLESVQVQS